MHASHNVSFLSHTIGLMLENQAPVTSMAGSYQSGISQDGSSYGDMHCSQVGMMGHQQYAADQYVQYSNPMAKIGHASQGMMLGPVSQQQQQQHMQTQQGPFSPSVGMMTQQQGGYGGYGMAAHGHPQQPAMSQMSPMMSPSAGWNQAQTSPNHSHGQFMSTGPQSHMSPYMNQGYHSQQMPQMNAYNPTNQMASTASAYIHSPNPMQTGMASPPSSVNMINQMAPRGPHAGSYPHQVAASQHTSMVQGGYSSQINQSMPTVSQYPGDMMTSHGQNQINSGNIAQHYPPYTGSQQPRADGSVAMSHYTGQNSAQTYCPPYQTVAQPRPNNATSSPRPTPPPQSITPNHSSNSQGSYGQSSLQQLEQLVTPSIGGANPYQQLMQQSSASPTGNSVMQGQPQQGPIYSTSNFPTTTVSSTVTMGGNMQVTSGMATNQGHLTMQGQLTMQNPPTMTIYSVPVQTQIILGPASGPLSPNQGMISQNSIDIQRLEQQLQQLMNMPQNQQISQQILDIQERIRILHSQHQLHMPQQQLAQNPQMHPQTIQILQHASPQQPPRMPIVGNVRMQQQQQQQMMPQPPQVRPVRPGPPHMQLSQLNGQSIQMQHQMYSRSPGLGLDQMSSSQLAGPMSQQSMPSPQKIQPFQVSFRITSWFGSRLILGY